MHSGFSPLDWMVFLSYFLILALTSYIFSKTKVRTSKEYFTGKNTLPTFAVAISIVATSQSAATFLGAPEYSYKNDFTFLGFYISSIFAILFVAYILIPKFYEMKAVTVYELLEKRYSKKAKEQAGIMFLIGRVFASGARLYIGALAVSMILFSDTSFIHVSLSSAVLLVSALFYTYFGGIKSVVLSDIIQAVIYIGAGLVVMFYLYNSLTDIDILQKLHDAHKLRLIDTSYDGKFNIFALFSGWLLLNIAAFGLDQDMTQRVLGCKNKDEAAKALIISTIMTIPVILIFLTIGSLLYLLYENANISQNFKSEHITVFMYYILNELPDGLRALVTVGAIAAALSSTNSVLGAMASVLIEDIYKPYKQKNANYSEKFFLDASKKAVIFFAFMLWFMSILSYLWQHTSEIPLVSFALGVMAFAYSGLLGVYFSAVFTNTNSTSRVPYALAGGFFSVLALQPYIFGINIGFAYQIVIATIISFAIMQIGVKNV